MLYLDELLPSDLLYDPFKPPLGTHHRHSGDYFGMQYTKSPVLQKKHPHTLHFTSWPLYHTTGRIIALHLNGALPATGRISATGPAVPWGAPPPPTQTAAQVAGAPRRSTEPPPKYT